MPFPNILSNIPLWQRIYQVRGKTIQSRKTFFRLYNLVIVIRLVTDISTDFRFHMRERERDRDRQRKEIAKTKGNKIQKWYLTYIRGRQKLPISQKMKNFVFNDNFHQIIYIIPAPLTPAPRPLYPHSPPLPPRTAPSIPVPRPLYPRIPDPPVHPPMFRSVQFMLALKYFFYIRTLVICFACFIF